MKRIIVALCAVTVIAAAVFGTRAASAQNRSVLAKVDITDVPTKEAYIISFTVPPAPPNPNPNPNAGRHSHPGDEFIYLIEGTFTFEVEGEAPVTIKAGETLRLPAGKNHRGSNPGTIPAKMISFGLFQKGVPDTVPAR